MFLEINEGNVVISQVADELRNVGLPLVQVVRSKSDTQVGALVELRELAQRIRMMETLPDMVFQGNGDAGFFGLGHMRF